MGDMILIEPKSLNELIDLLEERKDACLFRGQSPEDRKLNSTLARELRGETERLPRNYIPKTPPLNQWNCSNLLQYQKIILNTLEPHDDVIIPLNGRGDPFYELMRYVQQNPKQEKIKNAIPNLPTATLEFSECSKIGLYFSSYKLEKKGAIFCLNIKKITTFRSFSEALHDMQKNCFVTPCIIDPLAKLNDLDDQKPKRQKAVYVFQRDLRHPIDHYLQLEKILVEQALNSKVKVYLEEQGINEDFVFDRR